MIVRLSENAVKGRSARLSRHGLQQAIFQLTSQRARLMDINALIAGLSEPSAYPDRPSEVEIRQTHISAVFLAGDCVYKVKKPVAPGFLDFTTLDQRLFYCQEEVRLNRRLAPQIYLGVVPIVATAQGVRVEADGEPIEWAVKMRRLPEKGTLLERVLRDEVSEKLIEALARRIAHFHQAAERNDRIASHGRYAAVAEAIGDVLKRTEVQATPALSESIWRRIREQFSTTLQRLEPVIEDRALRGIVCEGHGDLHLDHVYVLEDEQVTELVIIDCIEFNERLRCLDPVADMAFTVMDLAFRGRRDLAQVFSRVYFEEAGDAEGKSLLALYVAYRAAVRGMVEGLLAGESEVPEHQRSAARLRAQAYWRLALGELETPRQRPALVLVGGRPGTGKSTLAAEIAAAEGFQVIRSDVVRKELIGLPAPTPTPTAMRPTVYSDEMTDRVYEECLNRAESVLSQGGRALIDATFREDRYRRRFYHLALQLGVPLIFMVCEANPDTVRHRLGQRRGDASDADWSVYMKLPWEAESPPVARLSHRVSTENDLALVRETALAILRKAGLAE